MRSWFGAEHLVSEACESRRSVFDARVPAIERSDLPNDMELDPVERCRHRSAGMGGPSSKRFEVCFAGPTDVGVVDEREGDQLNRINLDLTVGHAVTTARSHLRPPPEPERHGDVTRQHTRPQFAANSQRKEP